MIAEIERIKEKYTEIEIFKSSKIDQIENAFDDLISRLEVFSNLYNQDNISLNHGVYLYVESLKEEVKSLEYKVEIELLNKQ